MKSFELKFAAQKMTKEQMKAVIGGENPNCPDPDFESDYYCCTGGAGSGTGTHLGTMFCATASSQCSGGMLTNDVSRC